MLYAFLTPACGVNCHRRCQQNMAHTCGINSKEFSDLLKQIQLSPEKLNSVSKVSNVLLCIAIYCHICVLHVLHVCYSICMFHCSYVKLSVFVY